MDWTWEWSLQTIVQITVLAGLGWAGIRWVVQHYLKDMLAEQQLTTTQTEHILNRLEKLERDLAVVRDRTDRERPPFP